MVEIPSHQVESPDLEFSQILRLHVRQPLLNDTVSDFGMDLAQCIYILVSFVVLGRALFLIVIALLILSLHLPEVTEDVSPSLLQLQVTGNYSLYGNHFLYVLDHVVLGPSLV